MTSLLCTAMIITMLITEPAVARADEDEARYTAELELVAGNIARAIMTRDIETLLSYVMPEAADDARRTLATPDSGLACALFDTECLQRHLPADEPQRTAVADFFRRQPNARLRIRYLGMMMFDLESPYDFAMLTWVVPGSDADRKFPAHDLRRWSDDHLNMCLIRTKATGWRFHGNVGVFFCANTLSLKPESR